MAARQELAGLQILRAVAAALVVVHHALEESLAAGPTAPNWLITAGAGGVDIFFVISGFIMLYVAYPGAGAALTPGAFMLKRVSRIYPFYWFCCALMLGLILVGLHAGAHLAAGQLAAAFLLLPTEQPLIGVSWTLVFEMFFYVVFAATLALKSARVSLIVTTLTILAVIALAPELPRGDTRTFAGNPIALEFCFGLGLGYLARTRGALLKHLPQLAALLGFAALATAPVFIAHQSTNGLDGFSRVFGWGVPALLIVAALLSVETVRSPALRFAVLLGDASYALYLTHPFVMAVYAHLLKHNGLARLPQWPLVIAVLLVSVAVGLVAHLTVEKRLIALTRKWLRPASTQQEIAQPV